MAKNKTRTVTVKADALHSLFITVYLLRINDMPWTSRIFLAIIKRPLQTARRAGAAPGDGFSHKVAWQVFPPFDRAILLLDKVAIRILVNFHTELPAVISSIPDRYSQKLVP
jgi:hypothetical protein